MREWNMYIHVECVWRSEGSLTLFFFFLENLIYVYNGIYTPFLSNFPSSPQHVPSPPLPYIFIYYIIGVDYVYVKYT